MFTEEYYWLPAGVTWAKLEDYAKSASANVIPHSNGGLLTWVWLQQSTKSKPVPKAVIWF